VIPLRQMISLLVIGVRLIMARRKILPPVDKAEYFTDWNVRFNKAAIDFHRLTLDTALADLESTRQELEMYHRIYGHPSSLITHGKCSCGWNVKDKSRLDQFQSGS
jgi:hypothetical protein